MGKKKTRDRNYFRCPHQKGGSGGKNIDIRLSNRWQKRGQTIAMSLLDYSQFRHLARRFRRCFISFFRF